MGWLASSWVSGVLIRNVPTSCARNAPGRWLQLHAAISGEAFQIIYWLETIYYNNNNNHHHHIRTFSERDPWYGVRLEFGSITDKYMLWSSENMKYVRAWSRSIELKDWINRAKGAVTGPCRRLSVPSNNMGCWLVGWAYFYTYIYL